MECNFTMSASPNNMAVEHFMDEVIENALDIFEKKVKMTQMNTNIVALDALSTTEGVCRSFLEEINSDAVNVLGEKLAALGSPSHQLSSPQSCPDDEMNNQTNKCEGPSRTNMLGDHMEPLTMKSRWLQTENNCDRLEEPPYAGTLPSYETFANFSSQEELEKSELNFQEMKQRDTQRPLAKETGYQKNGCEDTSRTDMTESHLEPLAIQSGWWQIENNLETKPSCETSANVSGQGDLEKFELNIQEIEQQDTQLPLAQGTRNEANRHKGTSQTSVTEDNFGPLATQSGWSQIENNCDELEEPPYQETKPSCETSANVSRHDALEGRELNIQDLEQKDTQQPLAKGTVGESVVLAKSTSQQGGQRKLQDCDSEIQLQAQEVTQELKRIPKSQNIFFRLAKELLECGHQDNGVVLSQPLSSRKEGMLLGKQSSFGSEEESSSCPCRFDWEIHETDIDREELNEHSLDRNDQLDIDILEMNDRDELEDQEVPGGLELEAVFDPEETVEISLYEENKKEVHSPPLDLEIDDASVDEPPSPQPCGTPSADDLSSPSTSDSDAVTTIGDVLPGHQWFQTTSDVKTSGETVKRVTPIPICNRRRRVGLSRSQRVPSLHTKRLRLSEE